MSVGKHDSVRSRAAHLGPARRTPQVLDAAQAIAVEHGMEAVTIGAIATAMGVTRPVVYSCFTDRTAVIDALVTREERLLRDSVLAALPAEVDLADPERMFVNGFRALLHAVAEHPGAWRVVFDSRPDSATARRFERSRRVVADAARSLMEPALRERQIADLERKLPVLVELFVGAGETAVHALLRDGSPWTPDDLGEFVGRAVRRMFDGV